MRCCECHKSLIGSRSSLFRSRSSSAGCKRGNVNIYTSFFSGFAHSRAVTWKTAACGAYRGKSYTRYQLPPMNAHYFWVPFGSSTSSTTTENTRAGPHSHMRKRTERKLPSLQASFRGQEKIHLQLVASIICSQHTRTTSELLPFLRDSRLRERTFPKNNIALHC